MSAASLSFVPRFSLSERDQRWARVREFMAQDGIDALFVAPSTGLFDQFQANLRYLTGLGGNHCQLAAIFPARQQKNCDPLLRT